MWEALELCDELREYEAGLLGEEGLDPGMSQWEHAIQTAEACRLAYPDEPWLHLVGLIHGLGKLLSHPRLGSNPQWQVAGESFPVGCRFEPDVLCTQFFSGNPDRRKRQYNSRLGIYEPNCGLRNVLMSWGACEYLWMVLLLNGATLPKEAMATIRYRRFHALLRSRSAYRHLMTPEDEEAVEWLRRFEQLSRFSRGRVPTDQMLQGDELRRYYQGLMDQYGIGNKLRW